MKQVNLNIQNKIKIDNLTQRTVALLGQKGAGKSTLISMIGRHLDKCPVIIIDPVGGDTVKSKSFFQVEVTSKNISGHLNKWMKEQWSEREHMLIDTSRLNSEEFVDWCEEFFKSEWLVDGIVIVDEVHFIVPQMRGKYCLEFQKFVKVCRNKNVGVIISSQRPQSVSKEILALSDVFLIGRVVYLSDREIVVKLVKPFLNPDEIKDIESKVQNQKFLEFYVVDYRGTDAVDIKVVK